MSQATMTLEQMQAMILKLSQENEALKRNASSKVTLRISEKGALSVYGLGRFPVTLYKSQWTTLLGRFEDIKAFMAANASQLKDKE